MNSFIGTLASFILGAFKCKDVKSNHIFYKIVDAVNDNEFLLQCINTNAIFYARIIDIVFDADILHGLHPVQSCFVGIEYAKYIKKYELNSVFDEVKKPKISSCPLSRYGSYDLCYQTRNNELCFVNSITNEKFLMHPENIAFSEDLIAEFDAAQAFHIGLLAGIRMNAFVKSEVDCSGNNKPKLYAIK